ncbi:MAG TPA: ABC transporter ATP-binding protein [Chthoniobacterales bacterium]|jgi:branched-chain amino acid transport system ATP-binding protein|nr:ABC transporter ATP-binding protein [Chthoniobacterales bacterium]
MAILDVQELTKRFGGLTAVNSVSFSVEEGAILSVIGPNGAGKSTLFKLICSFVTPTSGRVKFNGQTITGRPPHEVARLGVVRTFQETTIFKEMTALQNVIVAHQLRSRATSLGIYFSSVAARADELRFRLSASEILDYLGLGAVKQMVARNLPHGHLRALGIAVAMAAEPKVLLLDEPFAGMNVEETEAAVRLVRGIRERGVTVVLVEHDMSAVMRISDKIVVLNFGTKIAEGTPSEIQQNEAVIGAYLGQADEDVGH